MATHPVQKFALYVLPGVAAGGAMFGARLAERDLDDPRWLAPVVLALILVLVGRFIGRWWRDFDEVARDAHRDAALWGGSVGLAAALVILVAVTNFPTAFRLESLRPTQVFTAGFACVLGPLMVAYLGWWAGWWLKRR